MENQSELYYKILKECAENEAMSLDVLYNKYKLSESSIVYKNMEDLKFIIRSNGNKVELLPQGFTTYLAISSQKQSNEQAQKATKYAVWALVISIASCLASIFFSVLSYLK